MSTLNDAHSSFMLPCIKEIVLQVNPGLIITKQAAEFVNTKLDLVLYYILNAASKKDHNENLEAAQIENLIRGTLQPAMAQWAIDEGKTALNAFLEAGGQEKDVQGARLVFPVLEIFPLLKERHPKAAIGGAIFLTGAIEYICADLLQAAGNRCLESEKNEIGLTDIVHTMTDDEELSKLFFVVSSDKENSFLKRKESDSMKSSTLKGGSLFLPPSKRSTMFKIEDKPFPSLVTPDSPSDLNTSKEKPTLSPTDSITDLLAQKQKGTLTTTNLYGGSRPLSMSINIESLQKMSFKGENILEKLKEVTLEPLSPMNTNGERPARLSRQLTTELNIQAPTLSIGNKEGNKVATPPASGGGESVLVRVNLPDNLTTSVLVSKEMTMGELIRYVVQKRCLKFDEYLVKSCDKLGDGSGVDITGGEELDSKMTVSQLKVLEVSICTRAMNNAISKRRGSVQPGPLLPEESRTMYLSEGGKDLLVMEVFSGRAEIIAGTIEKLIERLADENRQDMKYVDCILLTYRFYLTSLAMFEHLYLRYMIQLPANASAEEIAYFNEWQKPIQKKVISVIRWWVDNYWSDFNNDVSLLGRLLEFTELLRVQSFEQECDQLEASMLSQLQNHRNLRSLATVNQGNESQFLNLNVNEIATQLNLWNFELFRNIQPAEYVNNVLSKDPELFPNLDLFIKRFELESFWVATEVCIEKDLRRRVNIIDSFIRIAKQCREAKNFFSTFSIIGGLNLSCVQRLKNTWANVQSKSLEVFHSLEEVMSPYQNMKNYRETMLSSHPPIIPVLPVYLKDLLFTHDGNKTFVNKLVNLEKFKLIANQVRQIVALASIPYDSPKNETVLEYVKNPVIILDHAKLAQIAVDH